MENLYFIREQLAKGIYASALSPTRALAQVAIVDIGAVAIRVLEDAGRFTGKRFDLASDELTGMTPSPSFRVSPAAPLAITRFPPRCHPPAHGEDAVRMYEWFDRVGLRWSRRAPA